MDKALAGFIETDEVVFSVYFVNGQAATFTLKRKEDIDALVDPTDGSLNYVLRISERDTVLIDRKHVAYTRTQHVTRRRKAAIPGERDTPPNQTSAQPDTLTDE